MDGNVMLSTELDTRPVTQSLSNLKRKIVEVFKGTDVKTLQAELKEVTVEIKATEAQARKAQAALDALMSGEKTPQSIKELEKDLIATEKQAEKMSKGYDKMLAAVEKYKEYEGLSTSSFPEAQKFYEAQAALERYEKEWEALDLKAEQLRGVIDNLKQNPQLTPEAQKYLQTLDETSRKLPELQARYEELGQTAQKVGLATRLQQNSIVNGFQHIERRIIGLVKRVFFFTLITKALRAVRSQVSALITSDSQLSSSLALVKGNLATSFGIIWTTVLPAIRALINFLAKATSYLVAFISWLTGKSFKQGQQAMQSIGDASGATADNTGKIGKAAKKAAKALNRMLLPFDQMNILSKDTADNTGGTGGGGGAGGGGVGAGITWPKEMDGVMAKFEKFRDLILLIGAAFAAWKLAPLVANLLQISKFRAFVGLTALITGITLLVKGIKDLKKNGPSVQNVCDIIAGALLTVGGAVLLFTGATGLGAIAIAIGLVVLAFKNLYKNFKPFRKYIDGALKRIKKAFSKGKLKGFKQIGKEILLGVLNGMLYVVKKIGSWIKKNVVEPVKNWFKKQFGIASPAKEMLDIGKNIALGILEGILEPFKKIGEWIQENVLTPIKEALFGDGEDTEGFVVNIGTKFEETKESLAAKWNSIKAGISDTWTNIKSKFEDTKESLKQKWDSIKEGIADAWANIKSKFEDTKETLANKWNNIKAGLADAWANVKSKFEDTKQSLATKWTTLTSDIEDKVVTIISEVKEKVQGALVSLREKWDAIKDKGATLLADAKEQTQGALATIREKWDAIKDKGAQLTATAKEGVGSILQSIKDGWSLAGTITKTLTANAQEKTSGMLDKVKTAWGLAENATKSLTLSVADKTKTFVNNLKYLWGRKKKTLTVSVSGVKEKVADTLQKLKNAWKGWKGGTKSVTLSATLKAVASNAWNAAAKKLNDAKAAHPKLLGWLPSLPTLAQGAVIPANSEFLAILGDQKRGTNIETPLATMIEAFNTALKQSGIGGASQVNVYLEGDAKQLFKVVRVEANNYTQSTGKAAFNL